MMEEKGEEESRDTNKSSKNKFWSQIWRGNSQKENKIIKMYNQWDSFSVSMI